MTTAPSASSAPVGPQSLAADLAKQFESLFGARCATVPDPAGQPGAVVAFVPRGLDMKDMRPVLDNWRESPRRRRGTATLRDEASFVAHVLRQRQASTVIFGAPDRSNPSLTAVYDYHPANGDSGDARFCEHRAHFPCALSDEWLRWTKGHGQSMNQADFAAFIEDRIFDVILPAPEEVARFTDLLGSRIAGPSTLLQLARGLAVNVNTAVRQAVTLDSGEISVVYEETHTDGAGAPVKVPNLFFLAIPVFFGGASYRVPVRLRYRPNGKALAWSYHLYRPDSIFDDAFRGVCASVAAKTDVPLFLGAAEQ